MAENIIINGVDVSGCDYFKNNGKCRIPHYQQNIKYTCCNCSEWNCYYKQLKRKEQECEELKIMLKDLSYENQKFCYQIEEQTKQLEPFKDEYFKGLDNVVIAELAKKSIRITAENSKLEQTLTDIKEICKNNDELQGDFNVVDCDKYKLGKHNLANKIIQKISEYEVENERN